MKDTVTRFVGDSVRNAIPTIEKGDSISVWYDSKRADDMRNMEGVITKIKLMDEWCEITFVRDDGQIVYARQDGGLYSKGSNHPHNGQIERIEITT